MVHPDRKGKEGGPRKRGGCKREDGRAACGCGSKKKKGGRDAHRCRRCGENQKGGKPSKELKTTVREGGKGGSRALVGGPKQASRSIPTGPPAPPREESRRLGGGPLGKKGERNVTSRSPRGAEVFPSQKGRKDTTACCLQKKKSRGTKEGNSSKARGRTGEHHAKRSALRVLPFRRDAMEPTEKSKKRGEKTPSHVSGTPRCGTAWSRTSDHTWNTRTTALSDLTKRASSRA